MGFLLPLLPYELKKIIIRGGNPPFFWSVGDTFYPSGGG